MAETDIKEQMQQIFKDFHGNKEELIPILQATQGQFRYLPAEAMREISRFLQIPESTVYGVCTFYAQFKLTPLGKQIVRICRGTACHVRGAAKVLEEMEKELGVKAGETTADLEYTLETIACFGSCALAPVLVIDDTVHGRVTPSKARDILTATK